MRKLLLPSTSFPSAPVASPAVPASLVSVCGAPIMSALGPRCPVLPFRFVNPFSASPECSVGFVHDFAKQLESDTFAQECA